jgi:AbiV family abortive infection protein
MADQINRDELSDDIGDFLAFIETQNDLIDTGTCLLNGQSDREDYEQYLRLVDHVEQLWRSACVLAKAECFPQAAFLALSAIEEIGKVGVVRFQLLQRSVARTSGGANAPATAVRRRGNPFYSHADKQLLAAGAGAVVNNRLRRIIGRETVSAFLLKIRRGEIEPLRQAALYADVCGAGAALPSQRFVREDAETYCILAGELMAEVLGFEPSEWERLLKLVQQFEREIGHAWE